MAADKDYTQCNDGSRDPVSYPVNVVSIIYALIHIYAISRIIDTGHGPCPVSMVGLRLIIQDGGRFYDFQTLITLLSYVVQRYKWLR